LIHSLNAASFGALHPRRFVRPDTADQEEVMAMAEFDAKQVDDGRNDRRLSAEVEQEIFRAIARIEYGSIEVVIHDGKVVQIECREKIRVTRDEPGRKSAIRQIR
jgi:hypothetical protein